MTFSIQYIDDEKIEKDYKKAISELGNFFELNWEFNKPRIFLVKNRVTIDKILGKKTEDWVVGFVNKADVYMLDRENYEKESCHKFSEEEYSKTIKHELAHSFFQVISGFKNKPDWLWEGMAIYLSDQDETKNKPKEFSEFLDYYEKSGPGVYKESGFVVKLLVEKFGKQKILELIKSLMSINSKKEFQDKFKAVYGFELNYGNINEQLDRV
ncbi:hypothetical protein CMI42_00210 [Candidatus Pacearchaeota archaeon]|nr:hypothetical protein [Candidatus Pacearchaeota archaeon]|tara:strand:- start:1865 stop:2500 length:636 start_codon:yes stop_codon:yes gene_type:complete